MSYVDSPLYDLRDFATVDTSELTRKMDAHLEQLKERHRLLLESYRTCQTREASSRWELDTVQKLILSSDLLRVQQGGYPGPRAFCPVCKEGSSSPYVIGFSMTEGLRRHLTGWGNIQRCPAFAANSILARRFWDERFLESDLQEQQAKAAVQKKRKATEPLLCVDPFEPPELFEDLLPGSTMRSSEELIWAELRLAELGVKKIQVGRVISYIDDRADFVAYADPRKLGEICFAVYRLPFQKSRKKPARSRPICFRFADSWKIGISSKYEKRIADACAELNSDE